MQITLTNGTSNASDTPLSREPSGLRRFHCATLNSIPRMSGFGDSFPHGSQLAKTVGRCRHYQIAHGDVEVVARGHEIQRDRDEPGGDDIAANTRPSAQNDQSRDYFDYADQVHERRCSNRQNTLNDGTQVGWPIGKKIQELVQPGKDGYKTESNSKQPP